MLNIRTLTESARRVALVWVNEFDYNQTIFLFKFPLFIATRYLFQFCCNEATSFQQLAISEHETNKFSKPHLGFAK